MAKQKPKEIMIVCELCGRNTLHRIYQGDFSDDPLSKVCARCGLWEDYKPESKTDGFDRFQDDF